jgi:predicted negative regulator of RcsB-dependent stress response
MMQHSTATHKKGLSSLFTLICWNVWKERNARIFRLKSANFQLIIAWIRDEARQWSFANAKALRKLLFEPP